MWHSFFVYLKNIRNFVTTKDKFYKPFKIKLLSCISDKYLSAKL